MMEATFVRLTMQAIFRMESPDHASGASKLILHLLFDIGGHCG